MEQAPAVSDKAERLDCPCKGVVRGILSVQALCGGFQDLRGLHLTDHVLIEDDHVSAEPREHIRTCKRGRDDDARPLRDVLPYIRRPAEDHGVIVKALCIDAVGDAELVQGVRHGGKSVRVQHGLVCHDEDAACMELVTQLPQGNGKAALLEIELIGREK